MKKASIGIACLLAVSMSECALADSTPDVDALKQQMAAMQQQMQLQALQMQAMQERINSVAAPQPQPAPKTSAAGPLTTHIGGADVTLYGSVDLSADSGNNGRQHLSQISSNESFLGVRGGKSLTSKDPKSTGLRALFQIETMAEISGTPTAASSLSSRNSFAGIQGSFGKLMLGKYDTPYKRATASMDPFANSLGDYRSIMGNSAGEGRAEFDYRMPHSIFYDSPKLGNFTVNALFSPGQKLNDLPAASNYAFPQGELVCSGTQQTSLNGATPNSVGMQTLCNDGAFNNAWSTAFTYEAGPVLATIGYELHQGVNRTSDKAGNVSNESAAKIGVSYSSKKGNRFAAIYEKLYRNGGINPAYNERARDGFYLSDVQELGHSFDLMAAWANAGNTSGSPKFPGLSDSADMLSLGLKYHYDKQTALYLIGALLTQDAGAHYGLGAGEGHGAPLLSPRTDTGGPLPGQTLNAVSAGLQFGF